MGLDSTLSNNIQAAGDKASYDAACKRLFAEKIILAWIMKSCLEEYRELDVNEIAEKYIEGVPQIGEVPVMPDGNAASPLIHGDATEDVTISEGTVTYDVRFHATAPSSGELVSLIINIEAQNDFYPGYPLITRGIYYCSRMISSQYGTEFSGPHYEKIKKVYSIWVCMNPPKVRQNSITRYYLTEDNLVGNVHEEVKSYDLLTAIMICLGDSDGVDGLLRLLGVLLSTNIQPQNKMAILEKEFNISMTQALENEVYTMCNLSKGIEERGISIGKEQGISIGKEQGISIGKEQGISIGKESTMVESIRSLMETLKLTAEQAMDALRIPKADREKYIALIEQ